MTVTAVERRVYEFIVGWKKNHDGNSPTHREIMAGCKISSTSVVAYYLQNLEDAGLIEISRANCRNLRVVGGQWTMSEKREYCDEAA